MNLWPPFLFSGVRVTHLGEDWASARVRLRLRRWNANYVGTQFGGSLFSMTDPFWMLLLLHRLGRDYVVWDRAAEIDFVAPGRSDVTAEFRLDDARVAEVRALTADGGKALVWFDTDVHDREGALVARVRKQVYVRRKPAPSG
jgi:acyl-coenzyme A thioesterase PaaI-like protein